jgi:hypothetical protein
MMLGVLLRMASFHYDVGLMVASRIASNWCRGCPSHVNQSFSMSGIRLVIVHFVNAAGFFDWNGNPRRGIVAMIWTSSTNNETEDGIPERTAIAHLGTGIGDI